MRTGSPTSTAAAGDMGTRRSTSPGNAAIPEKPFAELLDQHASPTQIPGSDSGAKAPVTARTDHNAAADRAADAVAKPATAPPARNAARQTSAGHRSGTAGTAAAPSKAAAAADGERGNARSGVARGGTSDTQTGDAPTASDAGRSPGAQDAIAATAVPGSSAAKAARLGGGNSRSGHRADPSDAAAIPGGLVAQPAWPLVAGLPLNEPDPDAAQADCDSKPSSADDQTAPVLSTVSSSGASVAAVGIDPTAAAAGAAAAAVALASAAQPGAAQAGAVLAADSTGSTALDAAAAAAAVGSAVTGADTGTARYTSGLFAAGSEATANPLGSGTASSLGDASSGADSSNTAAGALDERTRAAATDLASLASLAHGLPQAPESSTIERSIAVPVSDPGWRQALAAQLQLFAAAKVQTATLKLSPEHLGPLEVHIDLQPSQINVSFVALHPETRHALEQSVPALRSLLAGGGLTLGHTEVQGEARSGSQAARQHHTTSLSGEAPSHEVRSAGAVRALGLIDEYA